VPLAGAARYGYIGAYCHAVRSELLTTEQFKALAASRSMGEFASQLAATSYGADIDTASDDAVRRGLQAAFAKRCRVLTKRLEKRYRTLFDLFFVAKYALPDEKAARANAENAESALLQCDRDYIDKLKKSLRMLPAAERQQLHRIVGSYFDLLNLYNLVKLRLLYKKSAEEVLSFMLPYADLFTKETLVRLCGANDLRELSAKASPLLGREFDSMETMRKALFAHHRARLLSAWNGYPFSIVIPFSLLRLIELEINDLHAIAEGVAFGLDAEAIESVLVSL
jgi:vacuolar-type H+-ATPase subunit C/Vma6